VSAALALLALAVFLAFETSLRPPGGGRGAGPPGPDGRPAIEAGVHHIDVMSGRASVRVNGRTLGDTPVDYVGTVGDTVSVELQQHGYVPVREDIQVTTTGTSTFNMTRATRDER
jgi:hypothetical protein